MRRILRLASVSILLAAAGVALLGVDTASCATLTATVVRMDDQGITVRRADGAEEHYNLAAGLQIPTDAQPGAVIDLTVEEDASGLQRVTAITTETTADAAAPAATGETRAAAGTAQTESAETDELPATASPVWLFGLLGVLGLAGGFAVRRRRQHGQVKERLAIHSLRTQ